MGGTEEGGGAVVPGRHWLISKILFAIPFS
jgi:hypothetical protein